MSPQSHVTRSDVAALAVEVGQLGAAVHDLHAIVVTALESSNTAVTATESLTSRMRNTVSQQEIRTARKRLISLIYTLSGLLFLTLFVITAGAITAAAAYDEQQDQYRESQYDNCMARNMEIARAENNAQANREFVANLIRVEEIAAAQGDRNAALLVEALRGRPIEPDIAEPVNCERVRNNEAAGN